jgi:hypothetical protein
MFIPDLDFFPPQIPDPTIKRGGNKFHKIENYLMVLTGTEKDLSQWTQNKYV